jgi:hypothetical protein
MTNLCDFTVLIVDFPGAYALREHLLLTGARVHVVSPAGALIWARARKIDAAFISSENVSSHLGDQLTSLGVRQVFVPPDNPTMTASLEIAS